MPCPVCNRTMHNLGTPERRLFWCPGCGTLKEEQGEFSSYQMPGDLERIIQATARHRGDMGFFPPTSIGLTYISQQADPNLPLLVMIICETDGSRIF